MATKVVNLDRVIASMVHHPKIDGMPLYARVDGAVETGDNSISAAKSPKWEEASLRSYGSPDNIRRVFITYKAVYVHLFRPVKGVKNISLYRSTLFQTPFDEILRSMQSGEKEYRVINTGLAALFKPWVCSNIEEVYFDWGILLSETVMNLGMGNLYNTLTTPGAKVASDVVRNLFTLSAGKGAKELSERYPRLKIIGYVQLLEEIYKSVGTKLGGRTTEGSLTNWANIEEVRSILMGNRGVTSLHLVQKSSTTLNTKFSVKDGIYKFDKEVLRDYFESLKHQMEVYRKQQLHRADTDKKEQILKKADAIKSAIEKGMDEVYLLEGMQGTKILLKIATAGLSKEEIGEIYSGLSSQGKERYKSIFEEIQ